MFLCTRVVLVAANDTTWLEEADARRVTPLNSPIAAISEDERVVVDALL